MCSAVRIVVCAPTSARRAALRRAAVGVTWQVVAAVADVDTAVDRMVALRGRVLVVDGALTGAVAGDVAAGVRAVLPEVLLVGVGRVAGADAIIDADALHRLPRVLADVLHAGGDHRH